jgi:hypothetical protein
MKKRKRTSKAKMAELGSRGGRRSAAKLTPAERTARARRAAAMRYGRERERDEAEARSVIERLSELRIFRDGVQVGVLDVATVKLDTQDAELQALYQQALDPGVYSLGRMDMPDPEPGGPIVDHACWTRLAAGDLGTVYAFKRELQSKDFTAEFTES